MTTVQVDTAYQQDFSHLSTRHPRMVIHAAGEADIVSALQMARSQQLPLKIRGAGFSCNAQTLIEDGLVLVNHSETPDFVLHPDNTVEVSGRTRWYELERALNRVGRSIPVLTYFLHTTIGGTLSAGGYGLRSVKSGAQVDLVQKLRLILPDGRALWCSPAENQELFQMALASQGQIGVIERAILKTIPARRITKLLRYSHASVQEMVNSLAWLDSTTEFPDIFSAWITGNGEIGSCYGMESASAEEAIFGSTFPQQLQQPPDTRAQLLPDYPFIAHQSLLNDVARAQGKHNLWCDYLLPYASFKTLMASVEAYMAETEFRKYLDLGLMLAIRREVSAPALPFAAHHQGDYEMIFLLGIYLMVPPEDVAGRSYAMQVLENLQAQTINLGGRPYLYGYHTLTAAQKEQVYGAAYTRLQTLRHELDPAQLFNTGIF